MKVYLAGPFFNKEQVDTVEGVESMCGRLGYEIFSPRVECYCPPDSSFEKRMESFRGNCTGIRSSNFVLARIDDFDPGTIWELGYAFGLRLNALGPIPDIYAFTTVPSRGLNLMLAQSVDGFLQGLPSVWRFLQDMIHSGSDKEAQQWKQSII